MNIVVFTPYFYPHNGGVERYVLETGRRLAKKHKLFVVTRRLPGTKEVETIQGIKVIRIFAPQIGSIKNPIPLSYSFKKHLKNPDVLITHTRFNFFSFLGGKYAKSKNIPWIHIEHGSKQVKYTNPFIRLTSRVVDATIGKWIFNNATKLAGGSKSAAKFAKCKTVLSNGTDTKYFNGRKKAHKHLTIVYFGRLVKEKGVHELLNAVEGLKVKVHIIGRGGYEDELKKMAPSNVEFLIKPSQDELRESLSSSDIFVNPSYAEGLPTSVLEAGAMGLAVIATNVGGTKEIIGKDQGFLIPARNSKILRQKLITLIKNKKLRERFGKNIQKKIREEFDWDNLTKKIEKIVKSL